MTLYAGWVIAGMLTAVLLTLSIAFAVDPHGTSPIGEGLLFLAAFLLLLPIGILLGYLRASEVWRKR